MFLVVVTINETRRHWADTTWETWQNIENFRYNLIILHPCLIKIWSWSTNFQHKYYSYFEGAMWVYNKNLDRKRLTTQTYKQPFQNLSPLHLEWMALQFQLEWDRGRSTGSDFIAWRISLTDFIRDHRGQFRTGIILGMDSANERWRNIVMWFPFGYAQSQNYPRLSKILEMPLVEFIIGIRFVRFVANPNYTESIKPFGYKHTKQYFNVDHTIYSDGYLQTTPWSTQNKVPEMSF